MVIDPRKESIKYIGNEDLTDDLKEVANDFLKSTEEAIFTHILIISSNLLKHYIAKQNEEEAIRRTEALIKNDKTSSITEATSASLESEKALNPKNLCNFVDDRTNLAIKKSEKYKTNKKRKELKKVATSILNFHPKFSDTRNNNDSPVLSTLATSKKVRGDRLDQAINASNPGPRIPELTENLQFNTALPPRPPNLVNFESPTQTYNQQTSPYHHHLHYQQHPVNHY